MARIIVTADDGRMTHSERVISSDLDAQHFRECLLERLGWAVADAELPGDAVVASLACRHGSNGLSSVKRGAWSRRGWESPAGCRVLASSW
jgi:hypothetical protein